MLILPWNLREEICRQLAAIRVLGRPVRHRHPVHRGELTAMRFREHHTARRARDRPRRAGGRARLLRANLLRGRVRPGRHLAFSQRRSTCRATSRPDAARHALPGGAARRDQARAMRARPHLRRGGRPAPQSPTYRQWFGLELAPRLRRMLFIPEGCAHGFMTLEDDSDVLYLMGHPYRAVGAARRALERSGLRHRLARAAARHLAARRCVSGFRAIKAADAAFHFNSNPSQ